MKAATMIETTPETRRIVARARALALPLRVAMVEHLADGPATVQELTEALGEKQPNTSMNLSVLRGLGLVTSKVDGRFRRYDLTDAGRVVAEASRLLARA